VEEPFLDAVAGVLTLCDHERGTLLRAYAMSVLEAELGPEVAARVLRTRLPWHRGVVAYHCQRRRVGRGFDRFPPSNPR